MIASHLLAVSPAIGQEIEDVSLLSGLADGFDDAPGFDTEPEKERPSDWEIELGAVVGIVPEYEGSDEYAVAPAPNVKIAYRRTIIFSGKALRLRFGDGKWRFGLIGEYDGGRDDDNDGIRGTGDVDSGVEVGGFIQYRPMLTVRLNAEVRQEVADGHDGLVAEIGATVKLPIAKPLLQLELATTYADSDYMNAYFGITPAQSARSGLRTFDADAGFKNVFIGVRTGIDLTEHWVIGGMVGYSRLLKDAKSSPIVDDAGSPNQFVAGIGLSYQF